MHCGHGSETTSLFANSMVNTISNAGWRILLTDLRAFQASSAIPTLTKKSRGNIASLSILSLSSIANNALYGVIHFSQILSSSGLSLRSVTGWAGVRAGEVVEAGAVILVDGLGWKKTNGVGAGNAGHAGFTVIMSEGPEGSDGASTKTNLGKILLFTGNGPHWLAYPGLKTRYGCHQLALLFISILLCWRNGSC